MSPVVHLLQRGLVDLKSIIKSDFRIELDGGYGHSAGAILPQI